MRLYKDEEKGLISGVCAGIAKESNIDVTILRVIWGAATLFFGVGLGLYILCWILFPDE